MKEAYRILPVYAGDVSGIASALYELGGMVVIHDPSGCNSTYNTHDEIRWYDQESYIFISGLNMRDAVLGNDKKFIDDIVDAFYQLTPRPRFIAICNSPVPFLNGTDFAAICRKVESRCKVKTFYVQSNGMYDYVRGAGLAFLQYARHMISAQKSGREKGDRIRLCILGATPLTYGESCGILRLRRVLERDGFDVLAVWAMGSSPEELSMSHCADVDLVISDTGVRTADYFLERYGIPYVAAVPVSEKSLKRIEDAVRQIYIDRHKYIDTLSAPDISDTSIAGRPDDRSRQAQTSRVRVYIGEAVLCESLASDCGEKAYVLCPFEDSRKLLGEDGRFFDGEEELLEALSSIEAENPGSGIEVFADPAYRMIMPEGVSFVSLPTLALSGRMYRTEFPDYFAWADPARDLISGDASKTGDEKNDEQGPHHTVV